MRERSAQLASLTGLAAVALLVVSAIVGGETPGADETADAVVSFYLEDESAQTTSSILAAYGALFLIFFVSVLRGRLRLEEGVGGAASATAFAGGLILALGLLLFAGLTFTLADAAGTLDPSAAQAISALNSNLFFPTAAGTEALLIGAGIAMIRGAAFPTWLGAVAIVIAILGLTPIGFFALLAALVWIVVVSVLMALRPADRRTPPAAAAPDHG